MAEAGPRPLGLLIAVVLPALVAAAITTLMLPQSGGGSPAPVARVPAVVPSVVLAPAEPASRPARPLGISIPAAGIEGPVDAIGLRGGALEIPPPGRAGWFSGGPRPGEPGRAVIVSHVDSQTGPELFFSLRTLTRGTRILVEDRRGGIHRFRLVRRRQIEKSRFRRDLVAGPSAHPGLVLVTCGGPFTPGEGYRDNVILYARGAESQRG
ncbi:MAG: class F sortase [Thermoleophilaceae bacterium]|nr:class F sortase [Thermoleophilaceae bacterium]